jgi:hypothetical protein
LTDCEAQTKAQCKNGGVIQLDAGASTCAAKCTCPGFFAQDDCSKCSLNCKNGGRANSACTQCSCAVNSGGEAFFGVNCSCLKSSGTVTLNAQPTYLTSILADFDSPADWVGKDRDFLTKHVKSTSATPIPERDVKRAVDSIVKAQSFVNELVSRIASVTKIASLFSMFAQGEGEVSLITGDIDIYDDNADFAFGIQAVDSKTIISLQVSRIEAVGEDRVKVTFAINRCPTSAATTEETDLGEAFMQSLYSNWKSVSSLFGSKKFAILGVDLLQDPSVTAAELDADRFQSIVSQFGFNGVSEASEIDPLTCKDADPDAPCLVDEELPPNTEDPNNSPLPSIIFSHLALFALLLLSL